MAISLLKVVCFQHQYSLKCIRNWLKNSTEIVSVIPQHLLKEFSMDNQVSVEYFIVDDSNNGQGSHYIYSSEDFMRSISVANKTIQQIESVWNIFQQICPTSELQLPKDCYRLLKQYGLYFALLNNSHLLTNKTCVVFGSTEPWIEATAYLLGCKSVTTIEYNNITIITDGHYPPIQTISKLNFNEFYTSTYDKYDIAFSISSFDHDGLGRYGDPLNPNGDIEAMKKVYEILKPEGYLFFSVPIGPDILVYNLHRIYGDIRLPLLLEGWKVLDRIAWNSAQLKRVKSWRMVYEPVFLLQKPIFTVRNKNSSKDSFYTPHYSNTQDL
eukprot:gene10204-21272_t